ncbi:MAG: phosphatidate cytidylyltransferase [Candidatus Eisenbacteria bacterium]
MGRDGVAIALSFVVVLAVVGLAEALRRSGRISFDLSRKIIHVGVGTWIVPTVLLFERAWAAALPPAIFVLLNLASRRLGLVRAMEEEAGDNRGTVLFPLSFVILILLFWNLEGGRAALAAGILVLAWGDAAAALVGRRWGRHRYRVGTGWRSIEGSIAMFVLSVVAIIAVGFWVGASPYPFPIILLAAAVATLLEAGSRWGMDNLLVPLGTTVLLWGLG